MKKGLSFAVIPAADPESIVTMQLDCCFRRNDKGLGLAVAFCFHNN